MRSDGELSDEVDEQRIVGLLVEAYNEPPWEIRWPLVFPLKTTT